jgi:hypothetical protein
VLAIIEDDSGTPFVVFVDITMVVGLMGFVIIERKIYISLSYP